MAVRDGSSLVADFLETNASDFLDTVRGHLTPDIRTGVEPFLSEWFQSLLAMLRGQPSPLFELMTGIVTWVRGQNGSLELFADQLLKHRTWFLAYCRARIKSLSATQIDDIVLELEATCVRHFVAFYARAERDAATAERRRFQVLSEAIERAFVTLDTEGRITLANAECGLLIGQPIDSFTGEMLTAWCDESTTQELRRILRQRRTTGVRAFDGNIRKARGTVIPCRFTAYPLFDPQGRREGLAVTMNDLTRPSDTPVEQRASVFERLGDTLNVGFQIASPDGRVIFTSAAARRMMHDDEEPVEPYCDRLLPENPKSPGLTPREEVMKTGLIRHEVVRRRHDGGEQWLQVALAPDRAPNGVITRFIFIMRDVTQLRALERSVFEQQRTSLATQLAVTVAHQLRNPLSVMIGFAEMLSHGMPPERTADAITRMLRNGMRCKEIVEDLLKFGQGLPSKREIIDVCKLVRDLVQPLYAERAQQFVEWRLPEGACPVLGIGQQLVQVFTSLIDNALDAGATFVQVSVAADQGRVRVSVQDNGPGVPADLRARIFQPFFTTHGAHGAVGLGLSLAQFTVQDHGGRLGLVDTADAGAIFEFEIPLRASPEGPALFASSRTKDAQQQRLLVVDDELDLLEMLRAALEERGLHVDTAGTAAEALPLLEVNRYNAAVIDVQLPGDLSGPQLYQYIRGAYPELGPRVMFITADTMSYETAKFLSESGRAFLEKPFLVSTFTDRVSAMLEAR